MFSENPTLLSLLREGDENAFRALVRGYHASLVAVLMPLVHERATAEEIAQETWLAVIKGLKNFEGRSSLKTWIFAIGVNLAKKRLRKDGRIELLESLSSPGEQDSPLDGRFDRRGHWAKPPAAWAIDPETKAEHAELVELVKEGIETLPEAQRTVIRLRDIEELTGPEVCEILDITAANQRVLLHRARTAVRLYVEQKLSQEEA